MSYRYHAHHVDIGLVHVKGPVALALPDRHHLGIGGQLAGTRANGQSSLLGVSTGTDMQGVTLRVSGSMDMVHACRIFVPMSPMKPCTTPIWMGTATAPTHGAVQGCRPGPQLCPRWGDCNDANADIHPGLEDPCDGVDNDCDQGIDEDGITLPFYLDIDGDGLAGSAVYSSCNPPASAFSEPGLDCNDLDATMYPGAPPTLMGVDNDCNGYILGLEQLDGGCAGDFNGDNYVNIQDLLSFLNDFGSTGFLQTDLNFDQHVGSSDLLLMLGLLGNDC